MADDGLRLGLVQRGLGRRRGGGLGALGGDEQGVDAGSFGAFASRFIPVVRHLIGIPAGIVRMSFLKFSISTLIGSGLWCAILCFVGRQAGKDEALMKGDLNRILIWVISGLGVIGALYYLFVHRVTRAEKK